MKAKEYVELFKKDEQIEDAMVHLAEALMEDVEQLIKARKAHTDSAFEAVFKEIGQRFNAARQKCPIIPKEVYSIGVKAYWPKIYTMLVQRKLIEEVK